MHFCKICKHLMFLQEYGERVIIENSETVNNWPITVHKNNSELGSRQKIDGREESPSGRLE